MTTLGSDRRGTDPPIGIGSEAVPALSAADGVDVRGARVLVIDDSKTIRHTTERVLTKAGCAVCTAQDGFEALGKIVGFQPDLIFVDIMMPRLDGYHTCALIKANALLRHTPVVMLSSKDGLFDRARGRLVGAELYLSKPFTGEELLDALRRYLRRAS